ncbi:unnamed protein product [Cylindrotheca closterium]|uniref:Uncharacterized protein n=1 Tax=Cylindrotheca closterium TaxID=2856 RepID=A0AAD2FVS2_9STRA|nr:unnamed protein product [Cylindrotheca closterium]
MFNLSVNISCEDSIEVVLQPFEKQFSPPSESDKSRFDGLLQSSVNIRQKRRSSFHFDDVDEDIKCNTKLSSLESTKKQMAAIDQKIQSLLKKYNKKPAQSDGNSLKSASTTSTLDCDSLSSTSSSFGDDETPCAKYQERKFAGIPRRLEIPASIAA